MTVLVWSGIVRMAVKQWTRASRVSVSAQVDTPENTAKQVIGCGLTLTYCPLNQGISKVTTTVFRSRESENSHQISGLYPNTRMAEERFNVGILRISKMPIGPGVRIIETPIKDTYHTSVLFTVKP